MLGTFVLLPLLTAAADTAQVNVCATEAPMLRAFFARQGYVAPPKVSKLMVDIGDGKTDDVEQDVRGIERAFNSTQTRRWLNLALYTAVTDDRADIADLLIHDGANVDARPKYPPFSTIGAAMFKAGWQEAARKMRVKTPQIDVREFEPNPSTVPMLE